MPTDRREAILERLFTILQGIDGANSVTRNRDQLPEDKHPAIALLDGDEEARAETEHRGRLGKSPNRVTMKPEIYVVLEQQKPLNTTVGQELNAFRVAILGAVLNDTTLIGDQRASFGLIGSNGELFHAGCVTDLGKDRTMDGQMLIQLHITYTLNPAELLPSP